MTGARGAGALLATAVAGCTMVAPTAPEIVITNESGERSEAILIIDEQPSARAAVEPGQTLRVPIPAGRSWRLQVGGQDAFDSVEGDQMPRPFDLIVTIAQGGLVNSIVRFRPDG